MAMHVYKKGIFRYRRLNKLTLFPFKSTYLAKVEVFILTSREWMSFVSAPPPPTWNKQERTSAYSDWFRSKLAGKVCLAVWPSFYQVNGKQNSSNHDNRDKNVTSRSSGDIKWCCGFSIFSKYGSLGRCLPVTDITNFINHLLCNFPPYHRSVCSAYHVPYFTSSSQNEREKNQSLGCM